MDEANAKSNDNKKKKTYVTIEHSAQMRALYQMCSVRSQKLYKMFPQYSKSTICEHMKKPIGGDAVFDKRKNNHGRPRLLTEKDDRRIRRSFKKNRKAEGSFTSPRVQVTSGTESVSNRTIRRSLNRQGYHYRNTRKKGVLLETDLKKRLAFCRKARRLKLRSEFWRHGISFYLDGKGFEYKSNPFDQARSPAPREWLRDDESLSIGCTAKGKKEGARNANFMVGIAYDVGVVLCTQYYGQITGEKFAKIVRLGFDDAFKACKEPCARCILMDNCTRQNSRVANTAIREKGSIKMKIPARSPDLNPIENFFHLVQKEMKGQALQQKIQKQSFEEFSTRCISTMRNFPAVEINKIIDSMSKRINLMIKSKGQRIKY